VKRTVQTIPTLVVEARALLREGITSLLHDTAYKIVASVASVAEMPKSKFPAGPQTLAILGLCDELSDTLQAIRSLREAIPDAKIVALGERHGDLDFNEILKGGANAVVFNAGSGEGLLKVFDLTILGQQVVILSSTARNKPHREEAPPAPPLPRVVSTATKSERENGSMTTTIGGALAVGVPSHLSGREQQVLLCVARGETNKTIARSCSITEATVKAHVKAILRKIALRNRTQAALWAVEKGLLCHQHLLGQHELIGDGESFSAHEARLEQADHKIARQLETSR
jgi:two-component system nitrate/nitrite response regulator NarL